MSTSKPTTTAAQTTETTEPEGEQALQEMIETWAHQHDPVGVAAGALFPDGSHWLGVSGLADVVRGIPITVIDRFEVGSITKTFMAALTMRLVEDGIVQLDETVSTYLPEFPAGEEMTIRNLLNHSAGVHDPISDIFDEGRRPDLSRVWTPEELLAAAAASTPTFAPGSAQEYSNGGYWVLGAVLEAATGSDAGSLLDSYVTDPLGLESTLLFDSTLPDVEVVNAYEDLDSDGETDAMGTTLLPGLFTPSWTAGGIVSTVDDLVMFLGGLFGGGLIDDASLDEMTELPGGDSSYADSPYALGIFHDGSLWGHDGGIWGYLSAVLHDVESGVTVAVLVNRSSAPDPWPLAERLAVSAGEMTTS